MPTTLELHQRIDARPAAIWKACTEPQGLANWQADEAEGEARLGGKVRLHWVAFDATIELSVMDWEAERRVVWSDGATRLEFELGDGGLWLRQSGLDPSEDHEGLRCSWRLALAHLAHAVERHPDRERRVEWKVRELRTTPELTYLTLTEPGLAGWLWSEGGFAPEGQPYRLQLPGGPCLSGKVLVHVEGRDLCVTVAEAGEALLALRTLPAHAAPGHRWVGAVWSEWGPPREVSDEILEALDEALDRLPAVLQRVGAA